MAKPRTKAPAERELPHNLEAERAVLGAAMVDAGAWTTASASLRDRDFYRDAHRRIFKAMELMATRRVAFDMITLKDALSESGELDEVGGPAYLASLTDGFPRGSNVAHHAGIVAEMARLRDLVAAGNRLCEAAYLRDHQSHRIADAAARGLLNMAHVPGAARPVRMRAAVEQYVGELVNGDMLKPLPTGYLDLDELIGGLQSEDMTIVAARPSVGKSAWALGVAEHMASQGHATAFISLEMRQSALAAQLLSWRSGVPAALLSQGRATEADYARLAQVYDDVEDIPLFLVAAPSTLTQVAAWCRRLKDEHGLACVVVDYLQMLIPEGSHASIEQEVAAISRGLKRLAGDLKLAVVALSQLSRAPETRRDKRPHLSDLRSSGCLEQDCDLAILLFRPEMHTKKPEHEGVAECIVAKNRTGPVGPVRLVFDKSLARFRNMAPDF
jgi:replicative DNA helicase